MFIHENLNSSFKISWKNIPKSTAKNPFISWLQINTSSAFRLLHLPCMKPPFLTKGDKVALVATAKKLDPNQVDGAMNEIRSWGLEVCEGANLYAAQNQFAGTDQQRAADLQWALDQPDIKAVIFARGGYGTARIIDNINWTSFSKSPKWLCGFSDLTVLHSHVLQNLGIETLHSTMPIFFKDGTKNPGSESLRLALFGQHQSIRFDPHPLNQLGTAKGLLVGGNLSVLYSISNTSSQLNYNDKILFIEDLTENLYHLDRMMMQFKRAGHLSNLQGLVVGQFTDMEDNAIPFGKTVEEIIMDAVSGFDYPVAFNAPIGHVANNLACFHGRSVSFQADANGVLIQF
jgi:muramoyltetrapeptide carboxypeptidase